MGAWKSNEDDGASDGDDDDDDQKESVKCEVKGLLSLKQDPGASSNLKWYYGLSCYPVRVKVKSSKVSSW